MKRQLSNKMAIDLFYCHCIDLAQHSGSERIRFGAIVVKNGSVLAGGWNRRTRTAMPIRMGYANHAEVEAMNGALLRGCDINNAVIYSAGYFPGSDHLYIPRLAHYTCWRCIKHFQEYQIKEVAIPLLSKWVFISVCELPENVKAFFELNVDRAAFGETATKASDLIINGQTGWVVKK